MANRERLFAAKIKKRVKCRKDRFETEFHAAKRAKILSMRSYFCANCRGFHLTSQQLREQHG